MSQICTQITLNLRKENNKDKLLYFQTEVGGGKCYQAATDMVCQHLPLHTFPQILWYFSIQVLSRADPN